MASLLKLNDARVEIRRRIKELEKTLGRLDYVTTYTNGQHVQPAKAEHEAGVCPTCFAVFPLTEKRCYCDYEVCCENRG